MTAVKLCFLSSNYQIGGLEKMIHAICKELNKDLFDFTICLLRKEGRFQELMVREFDGRVRCFDLSWEAGALLRFLRSKQFDVIQALGFRSDAVARLIRLSGRKSKIVSFIPNPDLPNAFWKKIANRLTVKTVDCFWADCNYRLQIATRRYAVPSKKIRVIYPGVQEMQLFHEDRLIVRKEMDVPEDSPLVISIGNLRYIKGHDLIVRASTSILKKYPESVFVMVGEDWTNGELMRIAKREGVEGSFRFTGYREDALRYVAASDLVLQPSRSEGIPRAVLEAMSFSKPVIASNVGGIPEVIQDGVNGFLIPRDNQEMLAQRTIDLLAQPTLRAELGRNAKETIRSKFSLVTAVKEFEKLYLDLCTTTRSAGESLAPLYLDKSR